MRWLNRFSLYDFEIVYRKDCNNQKADGFSRQPVYEDENEYNIPEEEKVIHVFRETQPSEDIIKTSSKTKLPYSVWFNMLKKDAHVKIQHYTNTSFKSK